MTTSIQIRFEGLPLRFSAIPWDIPHHTDTFEPMPDDASLLVVPHSCLFINQASNRRPQPIPLDEARKWGSDYDMPTELVFARAKTATGTSRFCLRLILNAERFINSPGDERRRAYDRLVREAEFHSTHLVSSEGYIVPVHYGMWVMDTGRWAGKAFLSVTQWCGVSWNGLSNTEMNTQANRILIARTFEALHDSGFQHGDIISRTSLRHVVIDVDAPNLSKADLLNGKARCYIVGFSKAQANHRCKRKLPILPINSTLSFELAGCKEAADVLLFLKFTKNVESEVSASIALNWHTRYRELHPGQSNMIVSIAQRARLYSLMPPVYPGCFTLAFEDESDVHSKAIVLPIVEDDLEEEANQGIADSDEETEQPPECVATSCSNSSSLEPAHEVAEPVATS
ncbi:hypothetical protein C8R47DRAFT_552566 [Mycena vitilis]|nr:hypothetical protein C8R47DRAFT_552566 [Mycena vitilis]